MSQIEYSGSLDAANMSSLEFDVAFIFVISLIAGFFAVYGAILGSDRIGMAARWGMWVLGVLTIAILPVLGYTPVVYRAMMAIIWREANFAQGEIQTGYWWFLLITHWLSLAGPLALFYSFLSNLMRPVRDRVEADRLQTVHR